MTNYTEARESATGIPNSYHLEIKFISMNYLDLINAF